MGLIAVIAIGMLVYACQKQEQQRKDKKNAKRKLQDEKEAQKDLEYKVGTVKAVLEKEDKHLYEQFKNVMDPKVESLAKKRVRQVLADDVAYGKWEDAWIKLNNKEETDIDVIKQQLKKAMQLTKDEE